MIVAPIILALALFAEPEAVPTFKTTDRAFGRTFVTEVAIDTIEAAPSWNDEADDNPPVSAKAALRVAKEARDSMIVIPDEFEWDRGALALLQAPHWVWIITFRAKHKEGLDPAKHRLTVVVLMDGTVIKPVVQREPTDSRSLKSVPFPP